MRALINILKATLNALLPALTILSLLVAIMHWRGSEEISASLATRYVGVFPVFMPDLEKVVDASTDRLLIASGFPGYGVYSAYGEYRKYQTAIESKVGRLKELKVIVLDANGRELLSKGQFRGEDFERDIRPTKAFDEFLKNAGYRAEQIATIDSFQRALLKFQTDILDADFRKRRIDSFEKAPPMPIFVWIADDR